MIRVAPADTNSLNNKNMSPNNKNLTQEQKIAKKPYALHTETIRRIFETTEEKFAEIISQSKKILSGNARFSCPVHGDNQSVVKNGHDTTNGTQKCICKEKHEKENIIYIPIAPNVEFVVYREVNSADGKLYFRSTTSYEALQFYVKCLKLSLDMVLNGMPIGFVVEFLGFSKALVEKALDMLASVEPVISIPENLGEEDILVIYMDFSSSGISKVYGIAAIVVNGQPNLLVSVGESYMQSYSVLKALEMAVKKKVSLEGKVIVIITDGSQAYPVPVKEVFPTAIHVRQIHDKKQRGIVLVHFSVPSGHEYTIRMRWDVFSEKPYNEPILDLENKDSAELYLGRLDTGDPHGYLKKKKRNANLKGLVGSKIGNAKLVFRGSLREMKQLFYFVCGVLATLETIFAGKFITTNSVESRFWIKLLMQPHRATKDRARILKCSLVYHNEIRRRVGGGRSVLLNLSLGRPSRPPPRVKIIAEAIRERRDLIITYVDRRGALTSRRITPCELYTRGKRVYLRAYCHLRRAYRTFRVDRICRVEKVG